MPFLDRRRRTPSRTPDGGYSHQGVAITHAGPVWIVRWPHRNAQRFDSIDRAIAAIDLWARRAVEDPRSG